MWRSFLQTGETALAEGLRVGGPASMRRCVQFLLSQNKKVSFIWNAALAVLVLAGMAARFVLGVWMRTNKGPRRTALSRFAELSLQNGNHSNRVYS